MESAVLKLRRTFRPMSVGSFYRLFLSIFIIFATLFYIQTVLHFNSSSKDSFKSREDIMKIEHVSDLFPTTRDFLKDTNNKSKGSNHDRNVNQTHGVIPLGALYNQNISSQYVQVIVRSVSFNRTSDNFQIDKGTSNISNNFEKLGGHFDTVLRINGTGSEHVANETLVNSHLAIEDEISLNSSKVISVENDANEVAKLGDKLLPANNLTRLYNTNNGTYISGEQLSRNITKFRKPNLRPRNSLRPNYCPLWPEELVGPMQVDQFLNRTEIPKANQRWIKEGGKFKPPDCDPRERTAIIIPYRDREKNLQVLLRHLHTVLQRQKIEYGIYVIEMAFPAQFNRGLLANVGFLTASSIAPYTCYIIHDVDLLMQDDRNMYRCGRVPRHLTAANSKYNNRLPYMAYFGGVEAFTPEQYWNINGFSNLYFGWGGEDDDMVYRIFYTNQHFSRPRQQIGGYLAMEHGKDSANPKNPNRIALVKSAGRRMKVDGIRSVAYNRLALEFKPYYTWVYVAAKEAKIMEKYQEFLDDS